MCITKSFNNVTVASTYCAFPFWPLGLKPNSQKVKPAKTKKQSYIKTGLCQTLYQTPTDVIKTCNLFLISRTKQHYMLKFKQTQAIETGAEDHGRGGRAAETGECQR